MKKSKAGLPKGRTEEKVGDAPKPGRAHAPQHGDDSLTCDETQIEDLLSEGEST